MRATETVALDGVTYHIGLIPPGESLEVLAKLMQMFGPGMAVLLAGTQKSLEGEEASQWLADAVGHLVGKMGPEDMRFLTQKFLTNVQVVANNKSAPLLPQMDSLLLGKVFTLVKLIAYSIRHNYYDFVEGPGGIRVALTALGQRFQAFKATRAGPSSVAA